jgi:hypothetical protein
MSLIITTSELSIYLSIYLSIQQAVIPNQSHFIHHLSICNQINKMIDSFSNTNIVNQTHNKYCSVIRDKFHSVLFSASPNNRD